MNMTTQTCTGYHALSLQGQDEDRRRIRLVLHTYNELVNALEAGDDRRAKCILDGLSAVLSMDSMPGLAVGLAGLYARLRSMLETPFGAQQALSHIRHLRDVWALAAEVMEN